MHADDIFAAPERALNQKEINELLKTVRNTPDITNRPVLGVNLDKMERAKNGDYPLHLYHTRLESVMVFSREEEEAVSRHGYTRDYKHREFPCFVFRRHFAPKFEASEYIEERTVQNQEMLDKVVKAPLSNAERLERCSPWVRTVAELPELERTTDEDPNVAIARLQEQLKAANAQLEVKKK